MYIRTSLREMMVRLLWGVSIISVGLLPCLVNSLQPVAEGRSFIRREAATDEEICGVPDYFVCSDQKTCCPNGFLCQGDGCVKGLDTNGVVTVIVTATASADPVPSKPAALGTGAIAGIAVGGVLFLIVVGAAIYFCVQKRKIGKEVLKAYEDPSRDMYDEVVVEGKRVSVVPIGGTTTASQRRQTQSNLSPPSEAQEFPDTEAAMGINPEEQYPQQQRQQYQSYQQQQQPQQYYDQQSTELSADQDYLPQQPPTAYIPEPIPDALRVGSPVSPIRADSMGLIPLASDTADGPRQYASMIQHHPTPPPHYYSNNNNIEPIPHSLPTMPSMPPPSSFPQQTHQPPPPATYQQEGAIHRNSPPPNNYPQYQQYPQRTSFPAQPTQQENRYSMYPHPNLDGHDPRDYSNNRNWGHT